MKRTDTMPRLGLNRIASAGIRVNKRGYTALALGIMLSIFFITSLCLLFAGVIHATDVRANEKTGWQDAFYLDGEATDAQLLEMGYFTEDIGHVTVTGRVEGNGDVYLGHYNETAARLLARKLVEGRFPAVPGEIALERSALEILRLNQGVGDTVTWTVTPVDGLPETRSYTIVGILAEQTSYIDVTRNMQSSERLYHWPQVLTCPSEPAFASGRLVQHRLLMLAPGVSMNATLVASDEPENLLNQGAYAVMLADGSWTGWPIHLTYEHLAFLGDSAFFLRMGDSVFIILTLIVLMAGALVLATIVGISGAMESTLSRRRETIGMLRCVGATKRQIRRIYGRESWLLALVTAPVAVGLACLLAWAVSQVLPSHVAFVPSPWLLLPVAAMSLVVILLASSLPLRRASQVMPMSVMRDTVMLRKQKHIRSKTDFRVHRLISRRQLMFTPTRQVGAVLLMALLVIVVGLSGIFGVEVLGVMNRVNPLNQAAFSIIANYSRINPYNFATLEPAVDLTAGDLNQIRTLPLVESMDYARNTSINLLVEEVPEYLLSPNNALNYRLVHLNNDPQYEEMTTRAQKAHREVQALLGTDKTLLPMNFNIMMIDPALAEMASGRIDLDALNAGREVLVYAPTYYYKFDEDGRGYLSSHNDDEGRTDWDFIRRNDYFTVGMELDLAQIWCYDTEWDYTNRYEGLNHQRATVRVGGIMTSYPRQMPIWEPTIFTTEEGARALGLTVTSFYRADIYLSALPDAAGEEALASRIEAIAMRGHAEVYNHLEALREEKQQGTTVLVVFVAIALVLFAVAVGMISGSITRNIRADVRLIGTLRAVGADDITLRRCYTGSLWLTVILGVLIGVSCLGLFREIDMFYFRNWISLIVPVCLCLLLTAAVALSCMVLVRLRIREITRRAIVENIREL